MKHIEFTIPGMPQGKARPRVVRRGNFTSTYTPHQTVVYENLVRMEYKNQGGQGLYMNDCPLRVELTAYFEPPASTSKKKLAQMLEQRIFPLKKPDTDNIAKIVCDALNGVAYHDDSQIVELVVRKRFSTIPYVQVSISEIDPLFADYIQPKR